MSSQTFKQLVTPYESVLKTSKEGNKKKKDPLTINMKKSKIGQTLMEKKFNDLQLDYKLQTNYVEELTQ